MYLYVPFAQQHECTAAAFIGRSTPVSPNSTYSLDWHRNLESVARFGTRRNRDGDYSFGRVDLTGNVHTASTHRENTQGRREDKVDEGGGGETQTGRRSQSISNAGLPIAVLKG